MPKYVNRNILNVYQRAFLNNTNIPYRTKYRAVWFALKIKKLKVTVL